MSDGNQTQLALGVESAVAHDSGLSWGVIRAHLASNGSRLRVDPRGLTIAAPKAVLMCLKPMLQVL